MVAVTSTTARVPHGFTSKRSILKEPIANLRFTPGVPDALIPAKTASPNLPPTLSCDRSVAPDSRKRSSKSRYHSRPRRTAPSALASIGAAWRAKEATTGNAVAATAMFGPSRWATWPEVASGSDDAVGSGNAEGAGDGVAATASDGVAVGAFAASGDGTAHAAVTSASARRLSRMLERYVSGSRRPSAIADRICYRPDTT